MANKWFKKFFLEGRRQLESKRKAKVIAIGASPGQQRFYKFQHEKIINFFRKILEVDECKGTIVQ